MYIYKVEINEPYSEVNSFEYIMSEQKYEQKEFEVLIYDCKKRVLDEVRYMDDVRFWEILKEIGFITFDFQATAYLE